MSDLPVLPLWVTKYEGNTAHLTLEEDGAYTRLLRLMWRTPGCSIPADDGWVMRHMRVDQATFSRVVKPILVEFFHVEKGRWHSQKLTEVYHDADAKSKRRQEAGSKGGKAKALKTNETASSNATAMPEQCSSKPEPKPQPVLDVVVVLDAPAFERDPEPAFEFAELEANVKKWVNGSLNYSQPAALSLAPIIRLMNPNAGPQACTLDDVRIGLTTTAAQLHSKGKQVASLAYFEKPILQARDERLRPIPAPEPFNERVGQSQRADSRGGNGSGASAARPRGQYGDAAVITAALRRRERREAQAEIPDGCEDWGSERVG